MTQVPMSLRDVAALRVRFRRTERLTAFVTLAATGVFLALAVILWAVDEEWDYRQLVSLALGLALGVGNVVFSVRNASEDVPWARVGEAAPAKDVRRNALRGDSALMDDAQVFAATRWAGQQSLYLRASVISSILTVAGLTGAVLVPQLLNGLSGPFSWSLVAIFGALVILCIPMALRQRRLDRFATRMGAWDDIPSEVAG